MMTFREQFVPVQQITTAKGFGALRAGVVYHLLRSPTRSRVVLVSFPLAKAKKANRCMAQPKYRLDYLSREAYETGIQEGHIRLLGSGEAAWLPEWLSEYVGVDFETDERFRVPLESGASHADMIDRRVGYLAPALEAVSMILGAQDPDKVLNKIARKFEAPHKQNESRYRLWFYVYLAFGSNRWALLPPYHRGGQWDRYEAGRKKDLKCGRESEFGKQHGVRVDAETRTKICASFEKRAKNSGYMTGAFVESMKLDFKCKIEFNEQRRPIARDPNGESMFSFFQYRYHVLKHFGPDKVNQLLLGDQKARHEKTVPQGSFSEGVTDVMETVYWDVARSKRHPRGYVENHALPKIPIAELIDAATGYCLSIGASVGGESAKTYRAALFILCIPKSKFGEIIGYHISDEDWPISGYLPLSFVNDGGPAKSKRVVVPLKQFLASLESTPTYTPQSNAPAESRHERARHVSGAPTSWKSHLNLIDELRWVAQRVITENHTASAAARTTPDMVAADVASSHDMLKFMLDRGRVTGIPVSFDEAVRAFLDKVRFKVVNGHLTLHGVRYRSKELLKDAVWAGKAKSWEGTTVIGYVLEVCPTFAWVEIGRRLIEVQAVAPLHGSKAEMFMPMPALVEHGKRKARLAGKNRRDRLYREIDAANQYEAKTGQSRYGGKAVRGSPKKTPAVKREMAALRT